MTTLSISNLDIAVNDTVLIQDLNLTFSPGQLWGILGPNGVGKTMLLHTLAGLRKPKRGNILLEGIPLHQIPKHKRAQNIGLLLQEFDWSFPNTVLDTALSGRYPHRSHWLKSHISDTRLTKDVLAMMGMDELFARDVQSLSGGEKQKLMLSTVFVQDPAIYLLDEPTNHLDILQRFHVLSLLKEKAKDQNKTIVMVLHDIDLIHAFCDQVLIVPSNRKSVFGASKEILKKEILCGLFPEAVHSLWKNLPEDLISL